jgi:hypothetical protein
VKVVGAGQAPYVVGQNGLVACAEVNVNYPGAAVGHLSKKQNRRRHRPTQSGLSSGQTQTIKRVGDTRLQNRWCKCTLIVDQLPVPYRGIPNWRWLWWRDRFDNLPDVDNPSHPAVVVDDP